MSSSFAYFAGGCFWCLQPPMDNTDGVISTKVGFTAGHVDDPTYEDVKDGYTGHYEAIQVEYAKDKVTFLELCRVFWRFIDPTDSGGQFFDRGDQYRTAIFYQNDDELNDVKISKVEVEELKIFRDEIVTEFLPFDGKFYLAEEYHQDFYKKFEQKYKREAGARSRFLQKHWKSSYKK